MKQLRSLVSQHKGSIDTESLKSRAIVVDAPVGYVWTANGGHAMRADYWQIAQQVAIDDMAERVGYGIEPCDDPDCDQCEEARHV